MIRVICLLLLLGCLGYCLGKDCSQAPGVKGCSAWKITPYRSRFTPACYKHDVCYFCGAVLGVSRHTCDKRFKDNMKRTCGWNFVCKGSATAYYAAVRAFGEKLYEFQSPSWCKEAWVNSCMS